MILGPAWQAHEVKVLNQAVASGLDWLEVAALLPGRSVGACQARLKRQEALKFTQQRKAHLRKKRTGKGPSEGKGQGRGGNRPWTADEDRLLSKLLADNKSPEEIHQAFPDRSHLAVAYRVGIKWSKSAGVDGGDETMDWDADESAASDVSCSSVVPQLTPATTAVARMCHGPYAPTAGPANWSSGRDVIHLEDDEDEEDEDEDDDDDEVNTLVVSGARIEPSSHKPATMVQYDSQGVTLESLNAKLEMIGDQTVELWKKIALIAMDAKRGERMHG